MLNNLNRITGQDKAVSILSKLFHSNKVPHAFLFTGQPGVGKFFTALEFSKALNAKFSDSSVLQKKISLLEEPYIKYVFPLPRGKGETGSTGPTDKLSKDTLNTINSEVSNKTVNPFYSFQIPQANNIKISSIREIKKFLSLGYSDIPYRVIIIENAHQMNDEAQNALLKSLEEPPEGVLFILITDSNNSLLPTIVSRCQKIVFNPLSPENIKSALIQYFNIKEKDADLVSAFADGSITNANKLIESNFELLLSQTINILRYSLAQRYSTALKIFSEVTDERGEEGVREITDLMIKWFGDIQKNRSEYEDFFFTKYFDTIQKFNEKFHKADIFEIQSSIERFKKLSSQNLNLNLIILNLIFEIGHIGNKNV